MRRVYARKRAVLVRELEGARVVARVGGLEAGFHVHLELDERLSAAEVARRAQARGVRVSVLSPFYVSDTAPGGRKQALATLHRRKRVADAINYFHRAEPARAEAAAKRVGGHAAALERAGVPADARVFRLRGWRLTAALARDSALIVLGSFVGLAG